MKTVLRTLISLCLIVWIGAEIFFPVVAALTFTILAPDTHTAGRIVGACLRVLHYEGLVAGVLLIAFLTLGDRMAMFSRRNLRIALVLVVGMLALTAVSQFGIIPRMEIYRIEAGGAIDTAALDDPARVAFERLHKTSEHVEEAVLLLGLVLVGLLATTAHTPKGKVQG
jgi:hypothetical protein